MDKMIGDNVCCAGIKAPDIHSMLNEAIRTASEMSGKIYRLSSSVYLDDCNKADTTEPDYTQFTAKNKLSYLCDKLAFNNEKLDLLIKELGDN